MTLRNIDAVGNPVQFPLGLISERTKAGLADARARGHQGGRKPKLTPEQLDRAASLRRARQLTVREIARLSGVTPNTLYRYLTPDGERRSGATALLHDPRALALVANRYELWDSYGDPTDFPHNPEVRHAVVPPCRKPGP